jgi:hypothetical protein
MSARILFIAPGVKKGGSANVPAEQPVGQWAAYFTSTSSFMSYAR